MQIKKNMILLLFHNKKYQASTWPKTQPQVGQGECDPSNEESPPLATQPFTPDAFRVKDVAETAGDPQPHVILIGCINIRSWI